MKAINDVNDTTTKVEAEHEHELADQEANHHGPSHHAHEHHEHVHGPGCSHDHHVATPYVRDSAKVGRNDPCPCGSGNKFKKCCGKN